MTYTDRPRRILVLPIGSVDADGIRDTVAGHDGHAEFVVIVPVLRGLREFSAEEDLARLAAEDRLAAAVSTLAADGVPIRGWLGDADPVHAIAEALMVFRADEVVIASRPEDRLAGDLVTLVCATFLLPVVHQVVEPAGAPVTLELTAA